ncbi:MAG: hypothetical protein LYZ66_01965 [Nitrososphaerales archaeon]|nr:hypothetical protein [Nitrososphaerales archaeon]
MLRSDIELASGLVKFYSKDEARSYLEAMLEYYRMRSEEYGQQMGGLLRGSASVPEGLKEDKKEGKEDKKGKDGKDGKEGGRALAKGWVRVGTLPVNTGDTAKAFGEVTLKIVEEYKMRVAKTTDALKSVGEMESINVSDGSVYTLFVNRGVPDALIVGAPVKKREVFSFAARFRAVGRANDVP